MKILVFSDTHRKTEPMAQIIRANIGKVDLVIHLGDNYTDLAEIRDDFPQVAFLGVCGNCDLFVSSRYPVSDIVSLEGHKLFFTHGHKYDIRVADTVLGFEAKKAGADIVLYGHTHVGACYEKNGLTFFNPGSLSEPRDGKKGSYGLITLSPEKCTFEHLYYDPKA